MVAYVVEQLDDVTLTGGPLDRKLDLMSPFVWKDGSNYRIMVRGVPWPLGPTDPTGLIGGGSSSDGLTFAMDDALAITPGPGPFDLGGCEDRPCSSSRTAVTWSTIRAWTRRGCRDR